MIVATHAFGRVRFFAAGAMGLVVLLAGCDPGAEQAKQGGPPPPPPPPVPVTVATARLEDVPVVVRTIGNVEPVAQVLLRPQIAGRVERLVVSEGVDVEANQTLIEMDRRPLEAALRAAQATLAKNRAVAVDARDLAERNRKALAASATSEHEYTQAVARAEAAEADVALAEARVDMARLELEYATLQAPFAGRLGSFLVRPGSIVKENETDLVDLTQIDPIDVSFTLPEQRMSEVRGAAAAGVVRVEATPTGDIGPALAGELSFSDNRVDPTTGSIRLKARFKNELRRLWPGQFVNVSLVLRVDQGVVTVPASAVVQTQSGPGVFVVGADQATELRTVTVRRTDSGRTILDRGVGAGETVVTEGQLRLAPGVRVQPKAGAAEARR